MSGPESAARVIFTGAGIALAVVAVLHGSGAFAQDSVHGTSLTAASTGGGVTMVRPHYDNQMLTAFAGAARDISGLRDRYMPRITAANIAERSDRAEALFDEMRARMHDAIDAAGLSVSDYEAISAASARNADLRGRIDTILTGGTPSPAAAPRTPVVARTARGTTSIADARRDIDDAAARRDVAALERKLADTERRLQNERREAARAHAALQARHKETVAEMTAQLAVRPSPEDAAAANRTLTSAMLAQTQSAAERTSLRREIAHLSRSLDTAVSALAALGDELAGDLGNGMGRHFTRLDPEPVLFAGSASGLSRGLVASQPNVVMQARLDAAQTRNLTLQSTHAAQRAALRREITGIVRDLSVTMESLSVLEDALVDSDADPRERDADSEVYLMDVPSVPRVDEERAAHAG
jgi:hypothetical protein